MRSMLPPRFEIRVSFWNGYRCWKNLEAAPRFELGMEVLQTSALPLGYAAQMQEIKFTGI